MPLLSVVVPFRNVERYVGACLESLRLQTLADLEVVLVDDGSTDGTRALVDAVAAADPRFRVIEQPNAGPGPARNAGIAVATGAHLAFVDADDVVHLDAYRRLTGLLAETGSDIAVGNAGRFNNLGPSSSYVHRVAITGNRRATHLTLQPELVLDRMAWNKVFRREFWDAHELAFPALMMGEDFPVSAAAHVAARSVDVSEDLAYYWREREGGEASITQRSAEFAHLDDRLSSAKAVLDIIETGAPDSLPLLREHFMDIDVTAVVAALGLHPEADHPAILDRAGELADRLGRAATEGLSPFFRIQFELLERRDAAALIDLHEARRRRGTKPAVVRRGRLRKRYFDAWPHLGEGRAPDNAYQLPGPDLEATVRGAVWLGETLRIEGLVMARMPIGPRSTLTASLRREKDGRRIEVPLTRFRVRRGFLGEDLVGFAADLVPATLLPRDGTGYWTLHLELGGPEVRGSLTATVASPESARYVVSRWLDDEHRWLVQPMRGAPGFGLMVRRPVALLTGSRVTGDQIELALRLLPDVAASVELVLAGRHGIDVRVPVRPGTGAGEFVCTVPLGLVADHPEYLGPIAVETLYDAVVEIDQKRSPVLCSPGTGTVTARLGHRELTATRNFSGALQFVETRLSPHLRSATWVGDAVLRFEGTWSGDQALPDRVLLEHFEHPADRTTIEVPLIVDGEHYAFEVDVAALVRAQRDRPDPFEGLSPPPWHLVLAFADHSAPQLGDRAALGGLPVPREIEGRRVSVTVERFDIVRVRVAG